ncbi:carbohydrate ABC transporter permease [Paenibacillus sp. J2TS4]|uniref:carbohydrate ABC transporter permease n=1 Tax=Paenibacillus sp. J2TS4 TaxID=2807194 RepID=UPI001AFDF9B5|nr:carbohydrate ABC transporter permease [Paenibacillus sp. J2TS4]GIP34670.1 sugar ABC transporter permease [Paenibacillus sp. J2TS4]
MSAKVKSIRNLSLSDFIFKCFVFVFVVLVCFVTLYPFYYILIVSLSGTSAVMRNAVFWWPEGLNWSAYRTVLGYDGIWLAYFNTVFYTVAGTAISLLLTALAAYPLSCKDWKLRRFSTLFLAITLWFGGGLIPFYLVVRQLGLLDTRLGILLYAAISTFYVIIMRTYFESLPQELKESAKIDGASDLRILFQIFIPLSKPVFAALGLYYAVGKWNSFFWESVFLNNEKLMPMQVLLMRIIRNSAFDKQLAQAIMLESDVMPITIQYATIIVTSLPIILVYPFLQKYFVKGVMIGAIKS